MMMAGMNKRSRSDAGVTSRQNVQVEHKEGGGRIFTIFPPWMESPNAYFQPPDLDKEMAESFSFLSRMSNRLVNGNKTVASVAEETKLGEEVVNLWVASLEAVLG